MTKKTRLSFSAVSIENKQDLPTGRHGEKPVHPVVPMRNALHNNHHHGGENKTGDKRKMMKRGKK